MRVNKIKLPYEIGVKRIGDSAEVMPIVIRQGGLLDGLQKDQ